jgi:hypothetical protein
MRLNVAMLDASIRPLITWWKDCISETISATMASSAEFALLTPEASGGEGCQTIRDPTVRAYHEAHRKL